MLLTWLALIASVAAQAVQLTDLPNCSIQISFQGKIWGAQFSMQWDPKTGALLATPYNSFIDDPAACCENIVNIGTEFLDVTYENDRVLLGGQFDGQPMMVQISLFKHHGDTLPRVFYIFKLSYAGNAYIDNTQYTTGMACAPAGTNSGVHGVGIWQPKDFGCTWQMDPTVDTDTNTHRATPQSMHSGFVLTLLAMLGFSTIWAVQLTDLPNCSIQTSFQGKLWAAQFSIQWGSNGKLVATPYNSFLDVPALCCASYRDQAAEFLGVDYEDDRVVFHGQFEGQLLVIQIAMLKHPGSTLPAVFYIFRMSYGSDEYFAQSDYSTGMACAPAGVNSGVRGVGVRQPKDYGCNWINNPVYGCPTIQPRLANKMQIVRLLASLAVLARSSVWALELKDLPNCSIKVSFEGKSWGAQFSMQWDTTGNLVNTPYNSFLDLPGECCTSVRSNTMRFLGVHYEEDRVIFHGQFEGQVLIIDMAMLKHPGSTLPAVFYIYRLSYGPDVYIAHTDYSTGMSCAPAGQDSGLHGVDMHQGALANILSPSAALSLRRDNAVMTCRPAGRSHASHPYDTSFQSYEAQHYLKELRKAAIERLCRSTVKAVQLTDLPNCSIQIAYKGMTFGAQFSMQWNPANGDLLTTPYNSFLDQPGMCCHSVHNEPNRFLGTVYQVDHVLLRGQFQGKPLMANIAMAKTPGSTLPSMYYLYQFSYAGESYISNTEYTTGMACAPAGVSSGVHGVGVWQPKDYHCQWSDDPMIECANGPSEDHDGPE
ncbi:uncharacterized protein L969DRAFT_95006 [Mixia osmundae IAM 14324]|uniref:Uncharacterized protein n=1 Tax=Mixia osmundae (strain CBS 9802 / IAM 14324 / JCM 22182 / KY 12970) TaxID=764103 RepID=G7E119_MIXOS|nr:uncharacterized protein L969DRAFT_95006 [Mixia osmundae IAM 14324]KEI38835.1 hypothetical protein L969DRAFT_95006 [Mixia osmundae IAM 14324]GAA96529.1 hypothetical protein E5Q_03197 [Mixia osmundae IAM 14324]